MSPESPPVPINRLAITACLIFATLLQGLDSTIANVSLPYMQASMSASQDEIGWVLTSYIVASAIMTPATGFLAARFGTRRLFLWAISTFTIASMLCGLAQSLSELVVFRLLQGAAGAALVPLTQSTIVEINPPERQGPAMAAFGIATMMGPVLGPVIGGWLTETFNWRYDFYLNVPVGILGIVGLATFLPRGARSPRLRMDWFGFGTLSLGLGALQLLMDRGNELDWFSSGEIWTEAVVSAAGFYLFFLHTFTTKERPFVNLGLFRARNFAACSLLTFTSGGLYFSAMALNAPYLQGLMNYPVLKAGLVMGPRGIGTMLALLTLGRFMGRIDVRPMLAAGLLLSAWSLYQMSQWTPDISPATYVIVTTIQGAGLGCMFMPLNVTVLTGLQSEQRTEGSAVYGVFRNMGASMMVSVMYSLLARNTQINHADVAAHVTSVNRMFENPDIARWWNPTTGAGRAALDGVITRQAEIIAYSNDFRVLTVAMLVAMPLIMLIRRPRLGSAA